MRFSFLVAFVCFLGLGLAACADYMESPRVSSRPGSPHEQLRGNAGTGGKAIVDVFLGQIHGQVFSSRNWRAANFSVNGVDVGMVTDDGCLHLELEPGVYSFGWRLDDSTLGPVKTAADYDNLQPNQTTYMALNIERNAGALLAPIGWWADPDRGHMADTYPRVPHELTCKSQPASAIMAKLHPIAGRTTDLPPSW